MRNLEEEKSESIESVSDQPLSAVALSNSSDQNLEQDVDGCPSNKLFVGYIEISKCEEEVYNLYNRLLENGINYKTEFWKSVKPHILIEMHSRCRIQFKSSKRPRRFRMNK